MTNQQHEIDRRNASFWDELCGTGLAQSLGITEVTAESLKRFDEAYFEYYPYLPGYVSREALKDKRVLEIGLGYGTLGNFIASRGCDYFGLDIAAGPAKMMQYRLGLLDSSRLDGSGQGSALALPFAGDYFDYVYTIGCLHHTGNLSLAIQEVHRVLKPGGKAIVMLYNRHSWRQLWQVKWKQLCAGLRVSRRSGEIQTQVRALYDSDSTGEAAPHTDFVSRREARRLFKDFSNMEIEIQNFDEYALAYGRIFLRRKWFLKNLARALGLDLYIRAVK
jgi:SAM-dependent methyltransferase